MWGSLESLQIMVQDKVIVAYPNIQGTLFLFSWNSYTLTSLHHQIDAASVQMILKASLSVIFKRSEKYLHSCGVHPNITKIGLKYMLVFLLEHCDENLNGWSAFGACTMCKLESRALSVKRICIAYLQLYLPCSVKLVTAIDYYHESGGGGEERKFRYINEV